MFLENNRTERKCPGIIVDWNEVAGFLKDSNDEGWCGWSYDLSLGDEVYLSSRELPIKLNEKNEFVSIRPGEFALLITKESVKLPGDVMAFISIRFRYKQKGLINISGFHVDPYYKSAAALV